MPERYTHGHHASVLRSHTWRTAENSAAYLLPRLGPGLALLDVGCGPGTITRDLARRVAPGPVVGIDAAPEVIERAAADAAAHADDAHAAADAEAAAAGPVDFRVADVYALPFADEAFDVVHAHQVLQHLARPVAALGEMGRVLRPGGTLAVRDADYGAFVWAPPDPALDRWLELYHEVTAANGGEADAGRHLPGWVRAAGFAEVVVSGSAWTFADPASRAWWGGLWAERVQHSAFARQAVDGGLSDRAELAELGAAFSRWAGDPDAVFVVPHVEVLARVR